MEFGKQKNIISSIFSHLGFEIKLKQVPITLLSIYGDKNDEFVFSHYFRSTHERSRACRLLIKPVGFSPLVSSSLSRLLFVFVYCIHRVILGVEAYHNF